MELYDAIFYRKSTRSYSNRKIKEALIDNVRGLCNNVNYLNNNLNIKVHPIERGHLIHFLMGKECKVKAPHYIVITSNKGEDYLQNVGYIGEEIILKLTSLGIATCWLECDLKRDDILEFIDLDEIDEEDEDRESKLEHPCAIIAFGYPEKTKELFRSKKSSVDREKVKDFSKRVDRKWSSILEVVRYAPSIRNEQPWMFYNDKRGFHLYEKKPKKHIEDSSKISMGIALKHFDIACKNSNIEVEYKKVEAKKRLGKKYFMTVDVKVEE
ncbi:hypothetical protein CHL78_018825 [Romboutsia weinsteinii]|uniref:Putative nitroreductase TM1586 domain-containing protein n=1 Tax=Romboutsia weinsteinii TaxID=2020949 RepID=A0A371IXU9_9FIRM|nr:nitroreductase family protein [Romboutsia weinsteinii]RDY25315.1 hypothetical protein CHL78_018825 [Romboutsia weinsteinii]